MSHVAGLFFSPKHKMVESENGSIEEAERTGVLGWCRRSSIVNRCKAAMVTDD